MILWWRMRRAVKAEERRARQLRTAERALKDAIYRKEKWSFANSPSETEDQDERIYGLIRKVERLGGDALEVVAYPYEFMCYDAMPEVFERVHKAHGNGWDTKRIESA